MPTFYVSSGMVMTDGVLVLGTTMAMLGFWLSVSRASRRYGYVFFVGLAIGLLAKGPLALVLVGMPVGAWVLISRRWRDVMVSVPWVSGTLLMLVIAGPWYAMAESKTPGFLDYFIVGEHFSRFFQSDWVGDKYGRAHSVAKGMIWIYWLVGVFPWFLVFLCVKHKTPGAFFKWLGEMDHWHVYLLSWAVCPLVFFTPAANIIFSYPLPSLPASAMLIGALWYRHQSLSEPSVLVSHFSKMALGATALCIGALLVIILRFPHVVTDRSQKALVAGFYQSAPANASLIYWGRYENPRNQRQFSAEYYTKGTVLYTNDIGHLARMTEEKSPLFLAVKHSRVKEISGPVLSRFKWRKTHGDFELFSTK